MATTVYRTIDGAGNNCANPNLNAQGTDFNRLGPAHFADGIAEPTVGPNARTISNIVVGQGDAAVTNPQGFSGMLYAWGQFLDHDLDLSNADGVHHIDITVPDGDAVFPAGSVIPMTRAVIDPATGKAGHPAAAVNAVTGWLDGSQVYGSTAAVAATLRGADGHMLTTDGGNLPIVNGQYLAGDGRAAENPSLMALQTLFVREHNFQVDRLHAANQKWDSEHLYQEARAIVTAEMANITYQEFLPKLLGSGAIDPYHGYNPKTNPTISEEFAGAAYRFGHSIVSAETERLDNNGNTVGDELSLRDTFFMTPTSFSAASGADGFLRHLLSDASQKMDVRIVDDLRNFLFDPPATLDLAAVNIQRGHDLGLGSLNQTRAALGLRPYTSFAQITDDAATVAAMTQVYGSVDKVDLWTGGLAEKSTSGAIVGQTFRTIISDQFERLRDGDRLYFENALDKKTVEEVKSTTLSDIIERNTGTPDTQDDAFIFAARHTSLAPGEAAEHPDAPQLVIGTAGVDTLVGGPKADTLVAASGTQVMTGLAGADIFRFHGTATQATITDFQCGVDKLEFELAGAKHPQFYAGSSGDTVVTFADTTVTLSGVAFHGSSAEFLV